jgi:hypothetical protein
MSIGNPKTFPSRADATRSLAVFTLGATPVRGSPWRAKMRRGRRGTAAHPDTRACLSGRWTSAVPGRPT